MILLLLLSLLLLLLFDNKLKISMAFQLQKLLYFFHLLQ
jgi:hypothetical protein